MGMEPHLVLRPEVSHRSAEIDQLMPAAPDQPFSVTVLSRYEEFVAIESEWRELFAAAERPAPYQRHRWLRLSWEMVWARPLNRLRVILVRDRSGALLMAGAFVIYLYRLVPTVEFLNSRMPQSEDVLWRPSPDTAAQADLLLETLIRHSGLAPMLRVLHLRDDSPLKSAVLVRGLRRNIREVFSSPYVEIGGYRDFDHYFSTRSQNLVADHRRRMRRLKERPDFSYTHVTGAQAEAAINWQLDTKRDWLAERGRTAKWLSSGHIDRFLRRLLAGGDDDLPEIWVGTFRFGDAIVSTSISLVERDVAYFFKIAHDPEYAKQSPGRTLTLNEIEYAFARGMREFDMGQGATEWKRRLSTTERIVTSERIWLR
jgi:CelD/BcsL family acetyltransferase involved in cellulose biosynthesis